jgi:phosphate/sulfate permease
VISLNKLPVTIYVIIVVVLFTLAVSDLIVGVSNDAVNFLNSAIGSRAASFRVIMVIAALGILIGGTFSSGMMEVARKGIFHPDQFYFSEIMIIFLAVMITDIILLDFFNTFGLPTSTTVSIVFELLGSAVAISLIKIRNSAEGIVSMGTYINSGRALLIISGILLSIFVAFTVGSVVQYITRLIFSFNFKKTLKYFGSVWGGFAVTAIIYFILIKGAKGSSIITKASLHWIMENTTVILIFCFAGFTVLMQLLIWLFRLNVLKFIVLIGTFALAMAFAGNDLVNFIGVPLAGFESFRIFAAQNAQDPGSFLMSALKGQVSTPTMFLLIAGLIMVITLWVSRKARSVIKTQLKLSDQDKVNERFGSTLLARVLVRQSMQFGKFIKGVIPKAVLKTLNRRFNDKYFRKTIKKDKSISFDLLRASVNLVVASILIAFGTSQKLPLSTTYVTFMVGMGTSLADGAWNRESAVYRITGVMTVIGGWFFTAMCAFSVSFLIALFISWLNIYAIFIMIGIMIFFIYRTHIFHSTKEKAEKKAETILSEGLSLKGETIFEKCNSTIISTLLAVSELYDMIVSGLAGEKRKKLKRALKESRKLNKEIKFIKSNINVTINKLEDKTAESGYHYVQVLDQLSDITHCLLNMAMPVFKHVDNNHAPLKNRQIKNLGSFQKGTAKFFRQAIKIITDNSYKDINKVVLYKKKLADKAVGLRKDQLNIFKNDNIGTRIGLLYLDLLAESKNLMSYTIDLLKTSKEFTRHFKP